MGSVRLAFDGRRADLVLDRPPLNILDLAALGELDRALEEVAEREDLQLLVVRGSGGRAFSAGVAVEDHVPDKLETMLGSLHGALRRLLALDLVTVAVVEGHCLGGGLELAACCDLVVASSDSRFGQPEVKLGCFPPVMASLLPRRLGAGVAVDLLVTGRTLDIGEALRLGLVHRHAPAEKLDEAVEELAATVLDKSAAVTTIIKRAVRAGVELPFEEALVECERIYMEELTRTEDMDEGIRAFLDKRPPEWRHR